MPSISDLPIITFASQEEWRQWLDQNHQDEKGLWIKIYKKATGKPTVTHESALEVALCYGWIDGQSKSLDEESYLQKFTPRRPKSIWSKINIGHIERLMKEGKMKPAGIAQVESAKADGRWDQAYDSPKNMKIPDDFLKELHKNKKAKDFFETLNKTNTYAIAWRLQTAKKPETREKRMKQILEMLTKGERFH
jgi:uncharacterized protein YdeI (YjbR/CyaY-like superfamily)